MMRGDHGYVHSEVLVQASGCRSHSDLAKTGDG